MIENVKSTVNDMKKITQYMYLHVMLAPKEIITRN